MEGFADFALEVDSAIDLIVPVADKTLDADLVAGSSVGLLRELETGALVAASERFEHVAGNDRVRRVSRFWLGPWPDLL